MKSQLFLFTGENTFELAEEVNKWKRSFLEKHGEANLQVLQGKNLTWSELLEEVRTAPFLGEKRLVIVEGMPGKATKNENEDESKASSSEITKEKLESLSGLMHPATILAFFEPVADKRKGVTKFLLKNATVKTFLPKTPNQLIGWLQNLAKENGSELDAKTAVHIISIVGSDQWHLKNECLKLIAYSSDKPTMEEADLVCMPSEKHTVWKMSDLIGSGKSGESVRFARKLQESGEDAFRLWNLFLWIARNMATIWMWKNEKNLSPMAISKEAGIPFPGVRSLMPRVNKFSEEEIKSFVKRLVEADEALKTGVIKATGAEPIELVTLLEKELLALR